MIIRFNEEQQATLQSLPETGMGYQIVDLTFKFGKVINYVMVYNCSECIVNQPFQIEDITDISMSNGR
jgi:hypothetical protein